MRNPTETQVAFHAEAVHQRRLAAGIALDDGWYDRLRARWPERLACSLECGPGWSDLIEAVCELCDAIGHDLLTFTQVKEKYGALRIYHYGDDEDGRIERVIDAAEEVSQGICETCGARGKVRRGPLGWLTTTCDEHAPPHSTIARVVWESRS